MTVAAPPTLPPDAAPRQRRAALAAAAGAALFFTSLLAVIVYTAARIPAWHAASLWLAAEVAFVFVYVDKLHRFSVQPAQHRPADHNGAETAKRFMKLRNYFAFSEAYLVAWFRDTPISSIPRQNVLDLLSYGFWYQSAGEVARRGELPFLDRMLTQLLQEAGIELKDGFAPDLKFMSHLWDALPASYRPLCFYALTETLGLLSRSILWAMGFTRHQVAGLVYYTHPGCQQRAAGTSAAGNAPVLLLHGVGAGLLPYLGLVITLMGAGRPIVAPEYRHVSMRLTEDIPTIDQLASAHDAFLRALGTPRVHVMGHSYGSLVSSRFVKFHPNSVLSLTLLDPVCFGMFMPTLLRSFLYVFPATGMFIVDAVMYLVSREIHMTTVFCRKFFWSDYNLWPENLPRHTLVSLSGRDLLSEGASILKWLTSETSARVMHDPHARHAEILTRPAWQARMLADWLDMSAVAEADAAAGTLFASPAANAVAAKAALAVPAAAAGSIKSALAGRATAGVRAERRVVIHAGASSSSSSSFSYSSSDEDESDTESDVETRRAAAPAPAAKPAAAAKAVPAPAPAVAAAAPSRPLPRLSPFYSALHAATAADDGISAAHPAPAATVQRPAPAASAPAPVVAAPKPAHHHHHRPAAAATAAAAAPEAGAEVEQLKRQLRQQQERVRAQEEANIAAAQHLLQIAEAVARSQAAAASTVASGPLAPVLSGALNSVRTQEEAARIARAAARGDSGSDDGSAASDVSSVLDAASSFESDAGVAVPPVPRRCSFGLSSAPSVGLPPRPRVSGAGDGGVPLRDLRSPFFSFAAAAKAAAGGSGAAVAGPLKSHGSVALAPRASAALAASGGPRRHAAPSVTGRKPRESAAGGTPAIRAFGRLRDSASIDLGALGHSAAALKGRSPALAADPLVEEW